MVANLPERLVVHQDLDKLTHNEGEDGDSPEQNERSDAPLHLTDGMEITVTDGGKRRDSKVNFLHQVVPVRII